MKKRLLAALLLVTLPFLFGCPGRPSAVKNGTVVAAPRDDSTKEALQTLRQATEPAQCREGLAHLNPVLQRADTQPKLQLSAEQRDYLKSQVHLSDAELGEVEAQFFRPSDAYDLAEAILLRDALRSFEIPGQSPAELTRSATRWVARHVLLHQQGDDWLPPAFVLQRGYGGERDRACVLLALLRQAQLQGCVLIRAGETRPVLVGVVDTEGNNVYLMDPRLGVAITKGDGALATLKDVQQDPQLLEPSKLTRDDLTKLEAWLVCPLTSLAPRLHELEIILSKQDRIVLALDAKALEAAVAKATGLPVKVWNGEPQGNGPESPTRALRLFLPEDEGGVDKATRGRPTRLKRAELALVPWGTVRVGLDQLRLSSDLAEPGRETLFRLIDRLFTLYATQPRDALLRGQYEQAISRLDRVRGFVEDDSLANLAEDPQFPKDLAKWRERANDAYRAAAGQGGSGQVQALWAESRYISALASDTEEAPDRFKKADQDGPALPRILGYLCREPLLERSNWLVACSWQDKAERAQGAANMGEAGNARAAKSAHDAWVNTRGAWTTYLDRLSFGPNALRQRLLPVRQRLSNGDPDTALSLLEVLHFDLHRYYEAHLLRGEATAQLEGRAAAREAWQTAAQELDGLLSATETRETGPVSLKKELALVASLLPAVADPAARQLLQQRLNLLERDWTEQGHLFWRHQRFEQALGGG